MIAPSTSPHPRPPRSPRRPSSPAPSPCTPPRTPRSTPRWACGARRSAGRRRAGQRQLQRLQRLAHLIRVPPHHRERDRLADVLVRYRQRPLAVRHRRPQPQWHWLCCRRVPPGAPRTASSVGTWAPRRRPPVILFRWTPPSENIHVIASSRSRYFASDQLHHRCASASPLSPAAARSRIAPSIVRFCAPPPPPPPATRPCGPTGPAVAAATGAMLAAAIPPRRRCHHRDDRSNPAPPRPL